MPYRHCVLFSLLCCCIAQGVLLAKPPGEVIYLQNGELKVGLSPEWGGAISDVQYKGRRYVDDNDSGRLIQSAFFSHADEAYNPTQGGASGNKPGGSLRVDKLSATTAYSRNRMLQWKPRPGHPAASDMMLEQWTTVAPDHIHLRLRWTNTGPRVQGAINQETPVIYMVPKPPAGPGSFNYVHAYLGQHPFTSDPESIVSYDVTKREKDPDYKPFGHNFRATEHWLAMTDEHGDGLTLFDPEYTDAHARRSYGIAPKFKMLKAYEIWGVDDPLHRNVRENEVWIFPGDWREARVKIKDLWINRRAWNFEKDGLAGWSALSREQTEAQGKLATTKGGVLFTPSGSSSGIEPAGINVAAAVYRGITLRYSSEQPQTMRVLFKHDQDLSRSEQRSQEVFLAAGQSQQVEIDFTANPKWLGQIRQLRLEPGRALLLHELEFDPRSAIRWDFNVAQENENWFPVRDGDLLTPVSDGQALVGKAWFPGPFRYLQPYLLDAPPSTGTLPRMTCWPGLGFDAAQFKHFSIRMKATNSIAPPRLYWHTNESGGVDRNYLNSPGIALQTAGSADEKGFITFVADLSGHNAWSGRVEQLMLNPVEGRDSAFEIDWIEIASTGQVPTAR